MVRIARHEGVKWVRSSATSDVYKNQTKGFTNGLEDIYVYAGYEIPVGNGISTKVIYHWFDSESSGLSGEDGGEELDLVASYKINKYLTLLGKYGDYDTEGGVGNADALDKKMFTFEVNFIY